MTTTTRTVKVDSISRDALLAAIPGCEVSFHGDDGYAAARALKGPYKNADFPAAVARPSTPKEVAGLLSFASEHGISISIISGGHSSVGMKGRLVISTRKMCTVEVDTTAMTVKIGGGCLAREVDAACAPHGIACVLGNAYTVGVAGLLMGGGYGHMARWQGLLVDTMLSATVVLASGEIVECSAESAEHAELFWALRGGGANFGVLVSVTVRAFKIGWDDPKGKGRLYGGMRVLRHGKGFPLGNRLGNAGVLKAWRDYCLRAPDEVSACTILPMGAPVMIQEYTYKGEHARAKEEAKEWKTLGRGLVSTLKMTSYYSGMQQMVGKMEEKAARKGGGAARVLNVLAAELPDAAVELLCHAATKGAPRGVGESTIIIFPLGGKIKRPADGDESAAFSQRDATFWIVISCTCAKFGKEPSDAQIKTIDDFLDGLIARLKPLVLSPSVGAMQMQMPYQPGVPAGFNATVGGCVISAEKMARLSAVKSKYDPRNTFWAVESGMSCAPNVDVDASTV